MRAASSARRPTLTRESFPRDATGVKTGDGALAAGVSLGLTSGGTLDTLPAEFAPALLRPASPWGPRVLLSSRGVRVVGSATGTGALAVTWTLAGSGGRGFYDLGTGDTLLAGLSIAASPSVGVNWIGTGALAPNVGLTSAAGVWRNGTGALVPVYTMVSSGSIVASGSATGTGTLSVAVALSVTAKRSFYGVGVLSTRPEVTSGGATVLASSGALAAQFSVDGSGSSSVRWDKMTPQSSTWTPIPRSRSSN